MVGRGKTAGAEEEIVISGMESRRSCPFGTDSASSEIPGNGTTGSSLSVGMAVGTALRAASSASH